MAPRGKKIIRRKPTPKFCFFCEKKVDPHYKEPELLLKCMSDRGKIYPRSRTGLCAPHQRQVTTEIKHARHVAILPFVVST